ncbi:hypothetical protein BG004_006029 [Podila humilis]|nr:hypothetical protein BG004_006029 [Podila humilis]
MNGTLPILEEQMFIKEKVARLFVEVAKRQWPGEWDDMDLVLKQMFFKNETTREMALLILRCLCEDVCIYDDAIAGLRKKDLRAGLLVIMASESALREQYPEGVKGHKNEVTLMVGEPGNDGWTSRLAVLLTELLPRCQSENLPLADEKIAVASLNALASSLDWAVTSSIASSSIIPLVCQYINSPTDKVRLVAAECFDIIASRTLSDGEKEKLIWPLVDQGGIDLISKAYLFYANQLLQGDAYLFLQKLVQATVNLGEIQVCGKRNAHTPQGLSKLLQLLYSMSSHQSILISSTASFFWTTILQHEKFSKDPNVHALVPSLLDLYAGYLAKDFENRRQHNAVYKHFSDIDFDSVSEFRNRASQTFQKAVDVVHLGVPVVLFKTVEYPMSKGPENSIKELRRRAASTLVKIGRSIPNTLFPLYGDIEAAIQRLIQQNLIWPGEKRTLLTFLLVIGFNADMAHDKTAIFEKVALPVIRDFQSESLQDALSTPQKFMAFIGAFELSLASSKLLATQEIVQLQTAIMQHRSLLSWSIETLSTFMRESTVGKDPVKLRFWSSYLGSILPNLLSTIRCLNAILDPALWLNLSSEMSALLNLTQEEKEMLVTGKYPPTATGPASLSKLISDLKIWLSVVRDHAYKFLAQLSALGPAFYGIPSLQTMLEQSLFENLDYVSNRQLRFLISSAVQPLVLNSPPELMSAVLSHLLGVLLPYLDLRLLKDWQVASDDGLVIDEKDEREDLDVSDEIVHEILLRDLTRSVADLVIAIFEFGRQTTTSTHNTSQNAPSLIPAGKEITHLAVFSLTDSSISLAVIQMLCHILTFKDTRSCIKATEAALCLLAALVHNYPATAGTTEVFASMVLRAALEAIHDPYHQEGQDRLILLITEVYVEVRAFDQAPKIAFQQLSGIAPAQLESFEVQLSACTGKSKKNAIVRNFLQGIIGVAKSEWFKQRENGNKSVSTRTIAGTYEKPSQSVLDSAQDEDIGEGLANLFDE